MRRFVYGAVMVAAAGLGTGLGAQAAERTTAFDAKIVELCKRHNVPERLVHRVIMRESRYTPRALSRGNYGLMQIRVGTARGMGYRGSPEGLLDAHTNLTYAVPYLANAYAVAGRDEDRAVRLYASGFYYHAKRAGVLGRMQTATAAEPADMVAYTAAPANPVAALFGAVTAPTSFVADAAAERAAAQAQMMASAEAADDEEIAVPMPPRRPRAYSTRAFKMAMRGREATETLALRTDTAE